MYVYIIFYKIESFMWAMKKKKFYFKGWQHKMTVFVDLTSLCACSSVIVLLHLFLQFPTDPKKLWQNKAVTKVIKIPAATASRGRRRRPSPRCIRDGRGWLAHDRSRDRRHCRRAATCLCLCVCRLLPQKICIKMQGFGRFPAFGKRFLRSWDRLDYLSCCQR